MIPLSKATKDWIKDCNNKISGTDTKCFEVRTTSGVVGIYSAANAQAARDACAVDAGYRNECDMTYQIACDGALVATEISKHNGQRF